MTALAFLGDVWLPRPFKSEVRFAGPYVFNLESPVTPGGRPAPGKVLLKAPRAFYRETFGGNPIAVCLANNHIGDYGREGFKDTLEALAAEGIGHFGAGTLRENGRNPLLLEAGGGRTALMAYACRSTHPTLAAGDEPGAMPIDLGRIARDIRSSRERGARAAVVHLHFGEQNVPLPKPEDVELARRIVELGADLIVGHHAHCIQASEVYKGKSILYGLGNAVFPDIDGPSHYGADGTAGRRYMVTQRDWNRRSLLVEYSVPSGEVRVRRLLFAGGVLREESPRRAVRFDPGLGGLRYGRRYARARRLALLRELAADFLGRPRLPRLSSIRAALASLRQA